MDHIQPKNISHNESLPLGENLLLHHGSDAPLRIGHASHGNMGLGSNDLPSSSHTVQTLGYKVGNPGSSHAPFVYCHAGSSSSHLPEPAVSYPHWPGISSTGYCVGNSSNTQLSQLSNSVQPNPALLAEPFLHQIPLSIDQSGWDGQHVIHQEGFQRNVRACRSHNISLEPRSASTNTLNSVHLPSFSSTVSASLSSSVERNQAPVSVPTRTVPSGAPFITSRALTGRAYCPVAGSSSSSVVAVPTIHGSSGTAIFADGGYAPSTVHTGTTPIYPNPASATSSGSRAFPYQMDIQSHPPASSAATSTSMQIAQPLPATVGQRFMMDQLAFYESRAAAADPQRDMRLDIDNMSYEDLLSLGESMGNVNTGLADEKTSNCVKEVLCCSSDQMQINPDKQDGGSCIIYLEGCKDKLCCCWAQAESHCQLSPLQTSSPPLVLSTVTPLTTGCSVHQLDNSTITLSDSQREKRKLDEDIIRRSNVQYIQGHANLPVLVFAHGFGCDQTAWYDTIKHLRHDPQYRYCGTLTYDLAFSSMAPKGYYHPEIYDTLDSYVEDLVYILRYYNISRSIFVGHSIAGMVGIQAAALHTELFWGLVLIGTNSRYLKSSEYKFGIAKEQRDSDIELMKTDYGRYILHFTEQTLRTGKDIAKSKLHTMMKHMNPTVSSTVASMIFRMDVRAMLPQVTVPCYLCTTIGNSLVSPPATKYMMEHLVNTKKTLFKVHARGHFPHLSDADLLAQKLSEVVITDWTNECQLVMSYVPGSLPENQRFTNIKGGSNKRNKDMMRILAEENKSLREENEYLRKSFRDKEKQDPMEQQTSGYLCSGKELGPPPSVTQGCLSPSFFDDIDFPIYNDLTS